MLVFLKRYREVIRVVDADAGTENGPLEIRIWSTGLDHLTNIADRTCYGECGQGRTDDEFTYRSSPSSSMGSARYVSWSCCA